MFSYSIVFPDFTYLFLTRIVFFVAIEGWRYKWKSGHRLNICEAQEICRNELKRQATFLPNDMTKNIDSRKEFTNVYQRVRRMLWKHYCFSFGKIYSMPKYSINPEYSVNLCMEVLNEIGADTKRLWDILSLIAQHDVLGIFKILRNVNESSFGEKSEHAVRCMFEELIN